MRVPFQLHGERAVRHWTYCTHCHLCPARYSFTTESSEACESEVPFPRTQTSKQCTMSQRWEGRNVIFFSINLPQAGLQMKYFRPYAVVVKYRPELFDEKETSHVFLYWAWFWGVSITVLTDVSPHFQVRQWTRSQIALRKIPHSSNSICITCWRWVFLCFIILKVSQ